MSEDRTEDEPNDDPRPEDVVIDLDIHDSRQGHTSETKGA